MNRATTYEFDDEEMKVLSNALMMYAGYKKEMELNMLVGDESDADEVASETATAESMARHFFEEHGGETWEEMSAQFASRHGRPMDLNDVSKYDWFEHSRSQ